MVVGAERLLVVAHGRAGFLLKKRPEGFTT
jgi:hypothetical protein